MPEALRAGTAAPELRPMRPGDLPAVMHIQQACYGSELLEPLDVLRSRLAAAGDTCWVAVQGGRVRAYLAAYRSRLGAVTALHGRFEPAALPDTLYLHDLAVHPDAHGGGLGGRLVDTLLAAARGEGLRWSALVAVQGAAPFWQQRGFALHSTAHAALDSYGQADYMVLPLAA